MAVITQKAAGVISGLAVAEAVFRRLDPDAVIERARTRGGVARAAGARAARRRARRGRCSRRSGPRSTCSAGCPAWPPRRRASCARSPRRAARARILDTRKTTPGLRALEKRAVADGGGVNHRAGLYDAILIKENHAALAGGVGEAVRRARAARPDLPLAVEVRDAAEIDEALAAGAPRLLLDNMTPAEVAAAVARVGGRAELEASGGVTPETVVVYSTIKGLDFVSMGALTHSAPALDLSLLLETHAMTLLQLDNIPALQDGGARARPRARRRHPRPQLPAAPRSRTSPTSSATRSASRSRRPPRPRR